MVNIAKPYLNNKVLPGDWLSQVDTAKTRLCRSEMRHLKVTLLSLEYIKEIEYELLQGTVECWPFYDGGDEPSGFVRTGNLLAELNDC
jgi:hypothetical protein